MAELKSVESESEELETGSVCVLCLWGVSVVTLLTV